MVLSYVRKMLSTHLTRLPPLDHKVVNGVIFEFISQCPENSVVLIYGHSRFSDAIGVFLETIKGGFS